MSTPATTDEALIFLAAKAPATPDLEPVITADASLTPAEARVGAIFRLTQMRDAHKALKRAEAEARLNLAAAIMAMDAAEDVPGRHNLFEQAAVEQAKDAYTLALANLLRGEDGI